MKPTNCIHVASLSARSIERSEVESLIPNGYEKIEGTNLTNIENVWVAYFPSKEAMEKAAENIKAFGFNRLDLMIWTYHVPIDEEGNLDEAKEEEIDL